MAESPQKPTEDQEPRNLDALGAVAVSEAGGVVDAIDRHRTKILAAIALSAVALCVILVAGQLKKQKHLDASEAFTSAATKGDLAALDAILIEYPGSIPAGNALLSKAELQVDQGKSQDAKATLERFIAEFGSHPRYAQGLFALANLSHVAGDAATAKTFYEKTIAAQPDGELTPLARIRLGDLALESGDSKLADQLYQESFTLHPGNPFFEFAQEKIALLKVGNPPQVDRPAPKPEPAPEAAAAPATPGPAPEATKSVTPAPAPAPAPAP
jgi:tetratricopeptide (TPR) repeat protein